MTRDDHTRDGKRWPRSVYDVGDDPDPRFTLANERTFLAWIRTALGLMAAAVALEALDVPSATGPRVTLVVLLSALGSLTSGSAYIRWARAERALRESKPLPAPALAPLLTFGLVVTTVVIAVLVAMDPT
jgi:putative membrane protein